MLRILLASLGLTMALQANADYPPNNLWYPVDSPTASSVTKSRVDAAVKLVREHYGPIMKKQLGCNLNITHNWNAAEVNAYASRSGSTCYVEFMGGFARVPEMTYGAVMDVLCHEIGHHMGGAPKYGRNDWASCEGQSDYWAQKCMKRLLGSKAALDAGLVLGKVLARFGKDPVPSYDTPDQSKANGIDCSHPPAQCRVDTYLAGIMNLKRPACWYNP